MTTNKLMIERVTRAIYEANPHTRVNKLVGDQYEPVPWEIASGNEYMEEYRLQALAAIMAVNSYKHSLSEEGKRNRAPLPPAILMNALQDNIHENSGKLIKATPLIHTKTSLRNNI